ncbi:MAG: hypothetical protein Q8M24_01870 [Pseudolabrys sp.]|nr:hypothetical protein [Pseudolabrys sp.]MDP2294195.1 hypothetical protein [Pseudolabrys sp.]
MKPRSLNCCRCGTAFACTGDITCWCGAVPYRLRVTDIDAQRDCLCPACLRRAAIATVR